MKILKKKSNETTPVTVKICKMTPQDFKLEINKITTKSKEKPHKIPVKLIK